MGLLRGLQLDWRVDLVCSSGKYHWLWGQVAAESAGQAPGHSFLPSNPRW